MLCVGTPSQHAPQSLGELQRWKSFNMWPFSDATHPSVESLVAAGFYYTPKKRLSSVQCLVCQLVFTPAPGSKEEPLFVFFAPSLCALLLIHIKGSTTALITLTVSRSCDALTLRSFPFFLSASDHSLESLVSCGVFLCPRLHRVASKCQGVPCAQLAWLLISVEPQ
jgi:Inhibitor of Apoptosis domain